MDPTRYAHHVEAARDRTGDLIVRRALSDTVLLIQAVTQAYELADRLEADGRHDDASAIRKALDVEAEV